MQLARSADKRLRIRSINMPPNLGGGREESNRNEIPARRTDGVTHRASQ
jgi:hypothetical protein